MTRLYTLAALSLVAGCGNSGGFPDAYVPDAPATGTFSLAWSVIDQDSQPLACERIAAQTMTVLAHNKAFDGGLTQIFSCNTGLGQSQPVYGGLFDLSFELSGTFGLLALGGMQTNVEIPAGTNTPLAPVMFQVDARGALALKLATNATAGNCGAVSGGGAGIDTMSITMTRNTDGACAPITFSISAGATGTAGTYTIDCATPTDIGCIESDQVLSVADVASDAYTIRVRGKIAGTSCWVNNDPIPVPPLSKTLTRTLNLAHQMQTPGC